MKKMKKIITGLAVFIFVAVAVPSAVSAQQNNPVTNSNNTTTQSSEDKDTERQLRIEEAKKNEVRITATEERRIAGLCKASQTVVARVQTKMQKTAETRTTRYEAVSKKLDTLVAKLKAASIDTTELEAAIAVMDEKIATHLSTLLINHQTALADLAEMDCASDPSGFKALLSEVRSQRAALVDQANELKSLVTVEVKTILNKIKIQLGTNNVDSEE
jgi:hypothetical protein